jgi:hypothetical protein
MARHATHPPREQRLLGIDDELPPHDLQAIDLHLASCEWCHDDQVRDARLLLAVRAAYAPVTASDTNDAVARMRPRLVAGLAALSAREATARTRRRAAVGANRWAMLTAAAMVALTLGWASMRQADRRPFSEATALPAGTLPIAGLTPGAAAPVATTALCAGDVAAIAPVSDDLRAQVLRDYGMAHVPDHEYELDYLITPDLGGTTEAANLWPERYTGSKWNARVKDHLELLLPRMVCTGEVDLPTAQRDIASNWVAAYRKYFRTTEPLTDYAVMNWHHRNGSSPAVQLIAWRGIR